MFSNLELRVVATIAYSNQFHFPLTSQEIWQRLIAAPVLQAEGWVGVGCATQITKDHVIQALQRLVEQGVVVTNHRYFALVGQAQTFATRVSRQRQTQQKAASITQLTKLLKTIPWITGVAITGSVAVQNAITTDDIDVLVITKPNRLWLTRLVVLGLALRFGKRVSLQSQIGNGWCFNLWLDADQVAVGQAQRSLYEAFEVLQAQFVVGGVPAQQQWLAQNRWVADFVPIAYAQRLEAVPAAATPASVDDRAWWQVGGDWLNILAYGVQVGYRFIRYQETPRGIKAAFFHGTHTKRLIYCRWRQLVDAAIALCAKPPQSLSSKRHHP